MPGDEHLEALIAKAKELEAEAIRIGEDGAPGRDLRARAAELRREALGERVYPVLVCCACYRLTGWVSAAGECDACVRRSRVQSAYADPHGGWVSAADTRAAAPERHRTPPLPLRTRLAAHLGKGTAPDRSLVHEWLRLVEPDETGPIDPEHGYEIEVAHRRELELVEGTGVLVSFSTATHRFADSGWQELETTRLARSDVLVPTEFPGALPVEQLIEAWTDYQRNVHEFNGRVWETQAAAREAARQAEEARATALREQRGVSELLDEDP